MDQAARRDLSLRPGSQVGRVEREAGERQAADDVAQDGRDLVPDQIIHHREVAAHDQRGWEQKHVTPSVRKYGEEHHDRHPHRNDLAADGGGNHGADHAGRNHPVTQHASDEQREHAGRAIFLVAERTRLADVFNAGAMPTE